MASPSGNATFDISNPNHRLGDYLAWTLEKHPEAPVDMIWISRAHSAEPLPHLIMPHGEPSIAVRRRRDRRGDVADIDLVICGPFGKARWYRPKPGEELIAARLKPELSAASFGLLAGEFLNSDPVAKVAIAESRCPNALRAAQYGNLMDIARSLLHDLLAQNTDRADRHAPEVIAAGILRRSNGVAGVCLLAERLEISERQLRRRFQAALGMSPKTYARQLRVTAAAMRADESETPNWAAIAAETGYFDQPHMIAEFRALCGQTPVETHAARRDLRAAPASVFSNTTTTA